MAAEVAVKTGDAEGGSRRAGGARRHDQERACGFDDIAEIVSCLLATVAPVARSRRG